MVKFNEKSLPSVISACGCAVYAPVERDGLVEYARYTGEETLRLDTCKTDKSPKNLLFPQWEDLMQFRVEGKTITMTEQQRMEEPYVLFGARACDLRAFKVLDNVFLADPVDSYYAARREHGTIVALACHEPEDSCFCGVFGIDPAQPEADVVLWKTGEDYCCESYTEKGAELLARWQAQPCTDSDSAAVEAEKKAIAEKLSAKPFAGLSLEGFDGEHLNEIFNSPKWEQLSMACLGCGSCTFSCPTCQCYDIRDYDTGHGVQRYRCWDSCMYSDFTMMASGTPRPTQKERFRQRFMHKLVYSPANFNGLYSCVGCGRCVRKCPANINIVKVIRALGKGNA